MCKWISVKSKHRYNNQQPSSIQSNDVARVYQLLHREFTEQFHANDELFQDNIQLESRIENQCQFIMGIQNEKNVLHTENQRLRQRVEMLSNVIEDLRRTVVRVSSRHAALVEFIQLAVNENFSDNLDYESD